jgi:hypothetical protein
MDLSKCEVKVVEVAENNIEKRYILYTKDGEEVVVHVESYGKERIERELAEAQAEIDKFLEYKNAKVIDEKIAVIQSKLDEVSSMKGVVDKVDSNLLEEVVK